MMPEEKIDHPEMLSPLALAYIGDAVYELFIRGHIIRRGFTRMNDMHREAVRYVRADAQSDMLFMLEEKLTPEEADIARKGRNAKSGSAPRGSSVVSYRRSTGLESLVGYLYLKGRHERLQEIMDMVIFTADRDQGGDKR